MLVEIVLGRALATTGELSNVPYRRKSGWGSLSPELICTDGGGRGGVRGSTHPVSASPSRLCNISQSSVVSSSTWRMPSIN